MSKLARIFGRTDGQFQVQVKRTADSDWETLPGVYTDAISADRYIESFVNVEDDRTSLADEKMVADYAEAVKERSKKKAKDKKPVQDLEHVLKDDKSVPPDLVEQNEELPPHIVEDKAVEQKPETSDI